MASKADDDGFVAVDKKHTATNQPSQQLEKWQSSNQFSALRSDRNIDVESSTATAHQSNESPAALTPSQQDAIAHLLRVCAENNVAISPHLRKAILGEELYDEATCGNRRVSRESLSKRESLLGSLIASHLTDMMEESLGETAREVQAKMDALENTNISVEARVKNGRYEVIVPASSKSGVIETVATSGAMVKLAKRIRGGKMKEETKVIMSGVNLFLEEGKMYLVLGAPGEFLLLIVLLLPSL
jgi:hypothetical protein